MHNIFLPFIVKTEFKNTLQRLAKCGTIVYVLKLKEVWRWNFSRKEVNFIKNSKPD